VSEIGGLMYLGHRKQTSMHINPEIREIPANRLENSLVEIMQAFFLLIQTLPQ